VRTALINHNYFANRICAHSKPAAFANSLLGHHGRNHMNIFGAIRFSGRMS